jgi:hypothetical protein
MDLIIGALVVYVPMGSVANDTVSVALPCETSGQGCL